MLASTTSSKKRTPVSTTSSCCFWKKSVLGYLVEEALALASRGSAAVVGLHRASSSLLDGCGPTSGALSRRRVPLLLSYGTHHD